MRAKTLALLLLALGCGLVASIGITQVMAKRDTAPAPTGEMVPIFVAKEDIPLREFVTAQMLEIEEWPKSKVPSGAISKIEDIEGRQTVLKLYAGEPILNVKLLGKGDRIVFADGIPSGYRALPVKVDAVSGGAAMIRPGDRVDVTVFIRANQNSEILGETGIRTLLEDIKVFAVDGEVEIDAAEQDLRGVTTRTISLLLNPEETAKVQLAMELGKINLVMRGHGDKNEARIPSMTIQDLFKNPNKTEPKPSDVPFGDFLDQAGKEPETPSKPVVKSPTKPRSKDSWVVRVWSGSRRKDMLLEAERDEADEKVIRWVINSSEPKELEAIIKEQSVAEPPPKPSKSKKSNSAVEGLIEQLVPQNARDALEELQKRLSESLPKD